MTDREALQIAFNALVAIDRETPYPIAKHAIMCINAVFNTQAQPEQENISRCKQCGGALPVTGALDRTGECDCIGQLKVISTIAWFNAPIKTEWGEDMMCASVSIDKNHTLTLYCERSQIHKVPNIIKELL